jgi:ubiquinone/menaquinone biosynthesis C-methylase UbiE
MTTASVKKLDDSALATFDHDYVSDAAFAAIAARIREDFPGGRFSFIDVGGGKGFFSDRVLAAFPASTGVVLDNADLLLGANLAHPRKRLVLGSATDLAALFPGERFDLAFFNFALHHFVGTGYADTRRLQRESLRQAGRLLGPAGRISVSEIAYDGALLDNLPSHVVYRLTASKALAPLVGKLGANTAGTGVCFMSAKQWAREFERLGYAAAVTREPAPPRTLRQRLRLAAVSAGSVANAHFWLRPAPARA